MPHMETPVVSLNGQEKSPHQNLAATIVSRRIQHKIFWDLFVTRKWNVEGWQLPW